MKPGTYSAKVMSHAIGETKKGDPQAVVTFSFEAEGAARTITWYGHFTEKTKDSTVKGLLACGLKGNNPAGNLEIGKEVSLVLEEEIDDETKKTRMKVRWVNAPGGGVRNIIPQDQAKAKLAALEGAVISARQKLNVPEEDEIPF